MLKQVLISMSIGLIILVGLTSSSMASPYPLANILPNEASEKLAKAEIKTTSDLLEKGKTAALRKKLAKAITIPEKQITEWVNMCDLLRIKGVGPVMTKLLAQVKVITLAQLQKQKAPELYKKIMEANEKAKVTENPPSEKHWEAWIEQAKQLELVVK